LNVQHVKRKKKKTTFSFDLVACACGWSEQESDSYYKLFRRKQLDAKKYKSCPFCYSIVFKPEDNKDMRIHCGNKDCLIAQDWCWKCAEPWRTNGYLICGNYACKNTLAEKNLSLATCQEKRFQYGSIDCKVPIFRACIACEQVIEHTQDCNHMTCICGEQFCIICLQKWPCPKKYEKHDPAPRQVLKQQQQQQ